MKIILLADVKSLGKSGELVEVSEGYARNYLFPKKLAKEADTKAMNEYKNREASIRYKAEQEKAAAEKLKIDLSKIAVTISVQGGKEGKMYGSVTTKDISDALSSQYDINIDKRKFVLSEAIKSFGTATVDVKLFPSITGTLSVKVVPTEQ